MRAENAAPRPAQLPHAYVGENPESTQDLRLLTEGLERVELTGAAKASLAESC